MGYLRLGTHPDPKKHLLCTFYVESTLPIKQAAEYIAAESSIGTWTDLATLRPQVAEKLGAKVYKVDPNKHLIHIAYPLDLFELGSLPQLASSILGNIFSMKVIKNLRLLNIEFPPAYINAFEGPKFGPSGIRKFTNIYKRPILGCIIKPKVGLSAKEQAEVAYNVWLNGIDLIKDDENLTDMTFNRFEDRVDYVMAMKKRVEKETKSKKIYVFNITGPMDVMFDRAEYVQKKGGECVMVDIVSTGLDNVQLFRKANFNLFLHGHRAGHSLFTKNEKHGYTMYVLAKLARLAGIDQLHTGTVVGKMEGKKEDILEINKMLLSKWGKIKPTLPIASGGLHPGMIEKLYKILGNDCVINFGGGVHGHPLGSGAGARAAYQSIEAVVLRGLTLAKAVKLPEYKELAQAVKYWGKI